MPFGSTIYNAISNRFGRRDDQAPADDATSAKIKQSATYKLLRPTKKDEKQDDAKKILQMVSFNDGDALDKVQVEAFKSKWRPGATVMVIAGDVEVTFTTHDDYVMTMSTYTDGGVAPDELPAQPDAQFTFPDPIDTLPNLETLALHGETGGPKVQPRKTGKALKREREKRTIEKLPIVVENTDTDGEGDEDDEVDADDTKQTGEAKAFSKLLAAYVHTDSQDRYETDEKWGRGTKDAKAIVFVKSHYRNGDHYLYADVFLTELKTSNPGNMIAQIRARMDQSGELNVHDRTTLKVLDFHAQRWHQRFTASRKKYAVKVAADYDAADIVELQMHLQLLLIGHHHRRLKQKSSDKKQKEKSPGAATQEAHESALQLIPCWREGKIALFTDVKFNDNSKLVWLTGKEKRL